jgi:L-rhamnose mutarotase
MERVCFLRRIRPGRLDENRARPGQLRPEMTRPRPEAGWVNYTLFLAGDGLRVRDLETGNYAAARRRMAETGANARWQAGG